MWRVLALAEIGFESTLIYLQLSWNNIQFFINKAAFNSSYSCRKCTGEHQDVVQVEIFKTTSRPLRFEETQLLSRDPNPWIMPNNESASVERKSDAKRKPCFHYICLEINKGEVYKGGVTLHVHCLLWCICYGYMIYWLVEGLLLNFSELARFFLLPSPYLVFSLNGLMRIIWTWLTTGGRKSTMS